VEKRPQLKIFWSDEKAWTDSLDISKNFDIEHADILKFIDNLKLSKKFKAECFKRKENIYWINSSGLSFLGEMFPHQPDPKEQNAIMYDTKTAHLITEYFRALGNLHRKIFRINIRRNTGLTVSEFYQKLVDEGSAIRLPNGCIQLI